MLPAGRRDHFHYRHKVVGMWAENLLLQIQIRQVKRTQIFWLLWVQRLSGGVGVFHAKRWCSNSSFLIECFRGRHPGGAISLHSCGSPDPSFKQYNEPFYLQPCTPVKGTPWSTLDLTSLPESLFPWVSKGKQSLCSFFGPHQILPSIFYVLFSPPSVSRT